MSRSKLLLTISVAFLVLMLAAIAMGNDDWGVPLILSAIFAAWADFSWRMEAKR